MEKSGKFIVLRKIKYADSDLIISALSMQGAKISFIARSALKSKKRFGGGVLDPLNYIEVIYHRRSESGLATLHEAKMINSFDGLKTDYDRLTFALSVLEIIAKVSQEGDMQSQDLFNLLGHTLKALNEQALLTIVQMQFYLKFLLQQGVFQPESWMIPFMQTPLNEHHKLSSSQQIALENMSRVRLMVQQYIETASVS